MTAVAERLVVRLAASAQPGLFAAPGHATAGRDDAEAALEHQRAILDRGHRQLTGTILQAVAGPTAGAAVLEAGLAMAAAIILLGFAILLGLAYGLARSTIYTITNRRVVMRFGKYEKEISEYIGLATNNIAELKAIQAGLRALKRTSLPVQIFTDSRYAYGVLALGWKAKANSELVDSIKKTMRKFKAVKIIKVKGHAGHKENERADFLATSAIKQQSKK